MSARTVLAIERYRLATNALPDTLDALVPAFLAAVPIDPYDGAPVRFKHTGDGYLVSCLSADCEDDGGRERRLDGDEPEPWEDADLVFAVRRK